MSKKVIGLHSSVYLNNEDLEDAKEDVKRIALIILSGVDRVSPLEKLALMVLQANGYINPTGISKKVWIKAKKLKIVTEDHGGYLAGMCVMCGKHGWFDRIKHKPGCKVAEALGESVED